MFSAPQLAPALHQKTRPGAPARHAASLPLIVLVLFAVEGESVVLEILVVIELPTQLRVAGPHRRLLAVVCREDPLAQADRLRGDLERQGRLLGTVDALRVLRSYPTAELLRGGTRHVYDRLTAVSRPAGTRVGVQIGGKCPRPPWDPRRRNHAARTVFSGPGFPMGLAISGDQPAWKIPEGEY